MKTYSQAVNRNSSRKKSLSLINKNQLFYNTRLVYSLKINVMKKQLALLFFICLSVVSFGQTSEDTITSNLVNVINIDGYIYTGEILSEDEREIKIKLEDGRTIYIPQYVIASIEPIQLDDLNKHGNVVGEDLFATRYFITTNGLPLEKGHNYVQWNIFGPDMELGIGKNLGVGIMTSWVGFPVIGTFKKSFQMGKKTSGAVGLLAGSGTWAIPPFAGVLGYGSFTYGNRQQNITGTIGYGAIWNEGLQEKRLLFSVAGMKKVSKNFSLVLDSFFALPEDSEFETYTYDYGNGYIETYTEEIKHPFLAIIIPGLRWQQTAYKAWQYGITGVYLGSESVFIPVPTIQFFRAF
jgi:hypothetical protein